MSFLNSELRLCLLEVDESLSSVPFSLISLLNHQVKLRHKAKSNLEFWPVMYSLSKKKETLHSVQLNYLKDYIYHLYLK